MECSIVLDQQPPKYMQFRKNVALSENNEGLRGHDLDICCEQTQWRN